MATSKSKAEENRNERTGPRRTAGRYGYGTYSYASLRTLLKAIPYSALNIRKTLEKSGEGEK
ncbi:hypothetical protein Dda_4717 [Drechslerella dactyloides]|uniref:Uncharacterized protein n=1 Tax=Drechslerella dactyloides TaxID=74499 RepID=A0AAD6J1P1_DREDA|nr:hypothetical protein Dda_4717 [Drechslerella dactyloides]